MLRRRVPVGWVPIEQMVVRERNAQIYAMDAPKRECQWT